MFKKLINKITELANHNQVLIALVIAFAFICATWGTEKLLEEYIFTKRSHYTYIAIITGALFALWLVKHIVLHEL